MERDSNRTGSGSTAPVKQNTPGALAIFFASPPAENMLRGGQCPPVAHERARVAPRVHFGPGLCRSFGLRLRPLTLEGNPSSGDPPCFRVGPQPGQGRRPLSLGLHHLGNQERVLLWLVMRGADGYEYPPSMRNELETSPTSKHAGSISLFVRYVNIYFSLFVRHRPSSAGLAFPPLLGDNLSPHPHRAIASYSCRGYPPIPGGTVVRIVKKAKLILP